MLWRNSTLRMDRTLNRMKTVKESEVNCRGGGGASSVKPSTDPDEGRQVKNGAASQRQLLQEYGVGIRCKCTEIAGERQRCHSVPVSRFFSVLPRNPGNTSWTSS